MDKLEKVIREQVSTLEKTANKYKKNVDCEHSQCMVERLGGEIGTLEWVLDQIKELEGGE